MSDLIVTALTPTLTSGAGLRTYGVAAALARHGGVEIAYIVWGADQPAPEYAHLENVTLRPLRSTRGPNRVNEYLRARARGAPTTFARGVAPALAFTAAAASADVRVIADGPVVGAGLLTLAHARDVVYLAHNLELIRFRDDYRRARVTRFERQMLRTFAESWMPTRADERGAWALAGERIATRYVPNVIDTAAIEPIVPAGARRLLLVADFTYRPNLEALDFLTGSVMPAVWDRMPDVRLIAIGRGLTKRPPDPRIETPGFVEDLAQRYRSADVVLVPLLRGGGSPLKFIEGLAYGLPVVATAHAARLLEDGVAGRDFLAAEGAAEFAARIQALLADRRRAAAIGSAGRELAARSYSVDALATLLSGELI
jgi:polysaccharide biosynthesis protein PslH